jgi:signal peptidase I
MLEFRGFVKNMHSDGDNAVNVAAQSPESGKTSEWTDFGKFLVKLGLFMFILRSFVVSPFNIPSESMQPRLLIGDYLLVAKWPYGYSNYSMVFGLPIIPGRIFASQPARGDVVVFKAPPTQRDDYIKRVIGFPGDTIQVRGGILFINDVAVKKERITDFVIPVTQNMREAVALDGSQYPCYSPQFEEAAKDGGTQCRYPRFRETLPGGRSYEILDILYRQEADDTQAFIVPEDHIFLMGDNRDRSADSRFPAQEGQGIGIVPQKNLVGRALVSVFSTDGSASWLLPWTWFTAARPERIGETF